MNFFFRNIKYCITNPRQAWAVRKAMQEYKKLHPHCECCDGTKGVEVHHIIPVHIEPGRAADKENFITVCRPNNCHLVCGHYGNYKKYYNIAIKLTAAVMLNGKRELKHFITERALSNNSDTSENVRSKTRKAR